MKQDARESGPLVSDRPENFWRFVLYVAQGPFDAECLIQNILNLCGEHLPGNYSLELVDPIKDPKRALRDAVVTFPTLVREQPAPVRQIIGADLADPARILRALEIKDIVSG